MRWWEREEELLEGRSVTSNRFIYPRLGKGGVESQRNMTKEMTRSAQFRTPRINGKSEQFKPTRLVT